MNTQKNKILRIIKSKLSLSNSGKENKIIILGFGVEGKSSFKFILDNVNFFSSDIKIIIADKRDKDDIIDNSSSEVKKYFVNFKNNIDFITEDSFSDLLEQKKKFEFDLIIKSPGISLSDSFIKSYKNEISSQIDLFLLSFSNQVIGITGTKGKSTTATLTHNILLEQGIKSILAGNIGKAVLETIDEITDETIIVLELSSHQLQLISRAPRTSVLLNIYPEHLDYYKTLEKYTLAKYNIISKQEESDVYIFPKNEFEISILEKLSASTNKPIDFSFNSNSSNSHLNIQSKKNNITLEIDKIKLPGEHNYFNISAAILAINEVLDEKLDYNKLKESIYNFSGLEHRLEYVGKYNNIDFYNDSISTIPQTTIAALKTFNHNIEYLILGGMNRSSDIIFNDLATEISKSKISNIFFMPETGKIIYDEILKTGFKIVNNSNKIIRDDKNINCYFSNDLESIISIIFSLRDIKDQNNSLCILSPASSSYNLFKNFEDRGKKFKEYIRILAKI